MSQSVLQIYVTEKGFKQRKDEDYEDSDNVIEVDREISFKKQNLSISIAIRDSQNNIKMGINLKENEARHLAEYILSVINAKY